MIYNVAVVDDDKVFVKQLIEYLHKFSKEEKSEIKINTFSSGVDFISNYKAEFDVVFMDIEMPGFSGMETARELRETDADVCLVFITNMAKYAIEGYSVSAMDFIVKPVEYFNFALTLKRAFSRIRNESQAKVVLSTKEENVRVNIRDIIYIETDSHYLNYHVGRDVYRVRGKISEAEKEFSKYGFARCHNGCLINMSYVVTFNNDTVILNIDGEKRLNVPISRYRKKDFLNLLTAYVSKK